MSDAPSITQDTPVIVLMTYGFLQQLQEIVAAPEMLSGAAVIKKAALLRALVEAVTVDQYNNTLIQRVLAMQAQAAAREAAQANLVPVAPAPKPEPVVANRAANFVPNRVKLEEQAKAAAKAKVKAKVEPPKRSHKKKEEPLKKTVTKATSNPSKAKAAAKKGTAPKKAGPPPKHRW